VATLAFVPLEVYELLSAFGWLKLVTFIVNVAVVAYLAFGKRLFGLRGGHAGEVARRDADEGWRRLIAGHQGSRSNRGRRVDS